MTAQILDGRALARTMRKEIAAEVAQFQEAHDRVPGIAVVQVGGDPASSWYVRQIRRTFSRAGMGFALHALDETTDSEALAEVLRQLSDDPRTSGIIVQMPLPKHLPQSVVIDWLSPDKDVDGIHPLNAGRLGAWRYCVATVSLSRASAPSWWGAATSWADRWPCSCCTSMPRLPSVTRARRIWPQSPVRRTFWWLRWENPRLLLLT